MNSQEGGDTIGLTGMVFAGRHGATPEEQAAEQQFIINLEMTMDLSPAGYSDELADTADYAQAYETVRAVFEGPSHALLESLAEEAAQRLLDELPIDRVRIRVHKPAVPLSGLLDSAWVEITRSR